jgi:isopenicillin-N epimerase
MERPIISNAFTKHWQLDPAVTFLNHGAFGACPISVLVQQQTFRQRLEQEPLRFVMREFEPLLDAARAALANFVNADPADLVFVPNATTGVNSVLRSLTFVTGDELLITNHAYNACRNALDFVAQRWGAKIVIATIPFPLEGAEQIIQAVLDCVTPRTKLALLDHITSPTAIIFPLRKLVHVLSQHGIDSLVDGAHAPGMVPLNLLDIGAAYYTGNCHKWMCAPKGAAFLYVKGGDRQSRIRPLTISHGANSPRTDRSRFQLEFDWTGTHDPTPFLCLPAVLKFMDSQLPQGWLDVMAHNHALALQARQILCETLKQPIPCPADMIGAIATIPLPSSFGVPQYGSNGIDILQDWLWETHHIEVPVIPWVNPTQRLIRVSAQLYNHVDQYHYLAAALRQKAK